MAEVLTPERETVEEHSQLERLIAHLRAQPFRFDYSRQDLADRFGLTPEFVGDVLDTLKGSPHTLRTAESIKRAIKISWKAVSTSLRSFNDELTERPALALPVTLFVAIALMLSVRTLAINGLLPVPVEQTQAALVNISSILIGTLLLLHALVYLRHGMMRYAAYGTGLLFVVSSAVLIWINGNQPINLPNETIDAGSSNFFLVLFSLLLSSFYFVFASVTSLTGGFLRTSRADREEKKLTRQELIDRLFQLQEKLKAIDVKGRSSRRGTLVETLRSTPWLPIIALLAGLVVGGFTVFMRGTLGGPGFVGTRYVLETDRFVDFAYKFVMGISYISLGYFSGGIRRSIVALTLFFAGAVVVELMPFQGFGTTYFEALRESGSLLDGLINTLLVALIVGVGAHIDKRAHVRQKVKEQDPAFVVAEMIEIQWRLNPTAGSSCVIVIDVAGSTRMKTDAEPLAVEYSFRAFHEFVAALGSRRGGTVISTAGDAAVLTFPSCPEALYVAKEVQTEIERFNLHTNRLEAPFRVRIGVHTGNVSAHLSDVPFNEVIDIAAHVEKEAPVGGIAITQPVADVLPDERVAELKEPVDGQHVYVVLNPTLVA